MIDDKIDVFLIVLIIIFGTLALIGLVVSFMDIPGFNVCPEDFMQKVYDLGMFERILAPTRWKFNGSSGYITRVPGGYTFNGAFVPFSDEFKEKK